ncbi:MAG: iron-sulfur cluster-binding domain-containing protein [Coriobacteriia bacterium]|nr:iron-sulfur cluster-binding domain-containing protein [Coriobacteriia bacterium]
MANEVELNLDPMNLMYIIPERVDKIEAAPDTPLPAEYPTNALMLSLHPEWQYAKIVAIKEHGTDAKSYVLTPDKDKGTTSFAYFNAGQYVCVLLAIGGSRLLRPYSIRSAPVEALGGGAAGVAGLGSTYVLTIKRAADGFASDYILDTWAVGDAVTLTGPEGNFCYEPLRDNAHILGIAGGSGITPFHSLASAIADGTEDCSLTLLYGSRLADDILLRAELDVLAAKTDKFKVIHVLSDEQVEGYEHGFITTELISKYAPPEGYSLFLCGPQVMYTFCDEQIEPLGLAPRLIRHELFGECKAPAAQPDFPGLSDAAAAAYTCTVICRDQKQEIPCAVGESLLVALERAGIAAPSRCRSGECGFCHTKLLDGEVFTPAAFDKRRLADVTFNCIHPCVTFPLGDVTIDLPIKEV